MVARGTCAPHYAPGRPRPPPATSTTPAPPLPSPAHQRTDRGAVADPLGLLLALLLAVAWGAGPALPALGEGRLLGHGGTDLYPSVWGLWWFATADTAWPLHTTLAAFPEGMPLYYSSPLKGLLARPLLPLLGVVGTWNALTVGARVATVLCAWAAARAWGAGRAGALAGAAVLGCAPFFHGYAVEGIVEGTDGWTLALWLWAVGRGRRWLALPLLALTILSSWYLGAAGLLLAALAAPWRPAARPSLLAPLLVLPALQAFTGAFPAVAPLDDAVRAAMGAPLRLPDPALLDPTPRPFAVTAWLGFLAPGLALLALRRAPRTRAVLLLAAVPAVLSLGAGPWYDLPGLELIRFPYRLHAATLALVALAAATGADLLARRAPRAALLLGPLIAAEGLLLSPVEPVLPGSPLDVPALYARVDGPVLELPGPVSMPPGQPNPSRPRARYLWGYQIAHGQPSPWVPDLNGVGSTARAEGLDALVAWDPLVSAEAPDGLVAGTVQALADHGVAWIVVHRRELGGPRAEALVAALRDQGARPVDDDGRRVLLATP